MEGNGRPKRPRHVSSPTLLTPTRPQKKRIPLRTLASQAQQCQEQKLAIDQGANQPAEAVATSVDRGIPIAAAKKELDIRHWSDLETKVLVEYIILSGKCTWPTHKIAEYWETLAEYMKNKSSTTWIRTGSYLLSTLDNVVIFYILTL